MGASVDTMPKLMTVHEVAELLRLRPARAYELARLGLIPTVRIGRQIRVSSAALMDFINTGGRALDGGWRREPVDVSGF